MVADHILTYALGLDGGGVERAQLRLIEGWIAAGRRVTLVLGNRDGALADAIPAGTEVIDRDTHSYLRLALRLGVIVADTRPDILFCAGSYYTGCAALARMRLGLAAPVIVGKVSNAADRGDHGIWLGIAHARWLRYHGRFLDWLVAMTPATADVAARAMRMEERVDVIPNPPAQPRSDSDPIALPPGRAILGVGRLAPQKRWDRLINALENLPPDVSLTILGEGPLRAALTEQAAAAGLASRVHLPGQVGNPFAAMQAARLVALTSDFEGVPGVLREALSVGTPVVATESSESIAEIISDPTLGTIVGRDDPAALVAALLHWLDAPRPKSVAMPGVDSAARYLELFDRLV